MSAQVSAPGSPSATEASRYPHPFRILLGPLIAAFSGLYSEAALNIALPSLMGVFDIPATVVQWLTTGYILAVGMVLPMFGLLLRWIPTRKPVVTAIVLFLVGATIAATAPSFAILLTGRIIQGVATGIMLPLVFNTAIAVYPVSRTGTAMGT
ncbi:MAG: MFS transporter, partial [Propionibacterium sp.]|nr:MFS transporter [Propionibacterium sp.]